uniref:ATP synthase F0 subunit 8 n=1 Tax=Nihonotrypaea thermophila TaxID=2734678 RepID=K4EYS1_NIHTH|nr:ATP synthase F0 subunit 8 [Neotrypaea thermophila]AEW68326.1 ATP synthase F0 subunit 8 [Neotrypaea thermophila]
MPQMSPLMWLVLMMMVVVIYSFFMAVNYFTYQTLCVESTEFVKKSHQKLWQW